MKDLIIDLIIQEERRKREAEYERPFLQLPLYDDLHQDNQEVKTEDKQEPKRVIIIDL